MKETEFAEAMEEAIRKAVETALKAYEAATHNEMRNAPPWDSAPSFTPMQNGAGRDEIEMLRERATSPVGGGAYRPDHRRKPRADITHEQHAGRAPHPHRPQAQDSSYHAAIRQQATQPDRLFDGLVKFCSHEHGASAAAQVIPARQDYQIENRGSLHTAIEQLRQDMNRNHSESANVTTRKNHSRP
jgi:hypothetical protein